MFVMLFVGRDEGAAASLLLALTQIQVITLINVFAASFRPSVAG